MRGFHPIFWILVWTWWMYLPAKAQRSAEGAAPEIILHNGKIVTMDDWSFQPNPGTLGQAMAVRDGKVVAVGDNESIVRLAGPQTRKIDLKGRTVLPGLVDTHDHLHDWVLSHDAIVDSVITERDTVVEKVPGRSREELERNLEPVLRQALDRVGPGKWVQLDLFRGEQNEMQEVIRTLLSGRGIAKEKLDTLAPENPVIVRGSTGLLLNQAAIDEVRKVFPPGSQGDYVPPDSLLQTGVGSVPDNRSITPDVIFKDRPDLLAELFRREMEWWAGYGITTWHSSVESSNVLAGYRLLDRAGKMPIRFAWSYSLDVQNYTPYQISSLALMTGGKGSSHLWLTGVAVGAINSCTSLTITRTSESRGQNYRENCRFTPGSKSFQAVKDLVKAGIPIRNLHTGPLADKDIDYFLRAIGEAAKEQGLSDEQIRAQRQAMDHCYGAPRPDQIPVFKKYGIIASCKPLYAYYELVDDVRLYGERWAEWVSPRKSLIDAGVMTTTEIDRSIGPMTFTPFGVNLHTDVTRLSRDGKAYVPKERIDRVLALKAHTIWGAHYVMREDQVGSLEPTKWADFIILDRDYLTVAEEEIAKIQVLATAVGGQFVHVRREIAAEWGESPKGAQALARSNE